MRMAHRILVWHHDRGRHDFGIPVLALVAAVAVISWASVARAAPEPEPIPRRWEYRLEMGDLRLACVEVPGLGSQTFFYLNYQVTNTTGEARFFAPSFELATDQGVVIRSGRSVPPIVSDRLLARSGNPFLMNEIDIQGQFLEGKENAKDGLVIWRADDLQVDEVTIYAAGFSGETRSVTRPDNGDTVLLRKTLMMRHDTPGDLNCKGEPALTRSLTRWIMRASSAR